MKIERINENKIRVTISFADLEERNIDIDFLNYSSPETQEFFAYIIEQAEKEFGFSSSNSQFIVDPETFAEEGFIINITRFDDDRDFESIQKYISHRLSKKDLKPKKHTRKIYSTMSIYSFKSFDDLCDVSKKINKRLMCNSALYKYSDTYYVVLTTNGTSYSDLQTLEMLLCEYGEKVANIHFYEGFLNEYGTMLIDRHALNVLGRYC